MFVKLCIQEKERSSLAAKIDFIRNRTSCLLSMQEKRKDASEQKQKHTTMIVSGPPFCVAVALAMIAQGKTDVDGLLLH